MEGKKVLRIEIDRDEDGTIEYYREDQTLEKVGIDRSRIAPVPSVQARHPPAERLDVAPDLGALFPAFLAVVVAA